MNFGRLLEVGAVHKSVYLVDLVKSFRMRIYLPNGVDTAENEPLEVWMRFYPFIQSPP